MSAMNSEQFFLKWNNFESNLASGFADLLQTEAMVDVTLAAEGKIVQAHKIILSICSSYFRNMFQVNPCQHPIVVLKDVRYQELTDMLDFMYKGEANVRQEDLPSFLKLAETLKIKGLAGSPAELDENTMKKNFSESQFSNLEQNSSPYVRDERVNDFLDKDSITARKKSKRCTSPFGYAESKDLHPNIKLESDECDNNFMRNNVNNCGRIANMKEERLSDSAESYGENRVSHESLDFEKNAGPSSLDENSETLPQEVEKPYCFVESGSGGHLLALGGYFYRKKSTISGKSYWFCCSSKCPAKGILNSNGDFQETNSKHNHKSDVENVKRKQKLVELKKLALEVDASGPVLLQALDIKKDVKKHLNFIRACRRRKCKRNMSPKAPVYAGLNYKWVPSRVPSKELLYCLGYIYRQDSVNPHNEKCRYFRCRKKNCKARAKTDSVGNLTILKPIHSHPKEKIDDVSNQTLKHTDEGYSRVMNLNKPDEDNPVTDSESFSLEKLMAETLADSYCDTPGITESLNLLKND